MRRLKNILLLFTIVYSVTCEDLQQVKRLGWLRAKQSYQYNHPPIVENDDIPVIYDKVIDRSSRIQKNLRAESAETVSILNNEDFDDTTTELLDTESTTEYYDVEKSDDLTEIPEEFSTTPKYKRRRFKLAKYSYEPASNPAIVAYNDEPSYTVRNRINYGFSGQPKYHTKPTYQAYESKTTTGTESEIDDTASSVSNKKNTQIESEAYNEDSISVVGFKRRPGFRRLRTNKKTHNFGNQGFYSSGVEQTEAEVNSVELDDKQLIFKESSTSILNEDTTTSTESNYDGTSGLPVKKIKATRKYFRRPQNFDTRRSYDAEISLTSLDTGTNTENSQNKIDAKQESRVKSLITNVETLNSKTETNYDGTPHDAVNNITISTRKFYKRPKNVDTQRRNDVEIFLKPVNIKTSGTHSETEASVVEKQITAKGASFTNSIKVVKSEEINYDTPATNGKVGARRLFKRPQKYATGRLYDAEVSDLSTNLEIENNKIKESATLDTQNAVHISNIQTSDKKTVTVIKNNNEIEPGSVAKSSSNTLKHIKRPQVLAIRHYEASEVSFLSENDQTNSTESKTNTAFTVDKQNTGQISNVHSVTSAEQLAGYENEAGPAFNNKKSTLYQHYNTPEAFFSSTNSEKENSQIKTDENGVAENFGTVQISNTHASKINAESANNNYETESGSTEKSQLSSLKHLKRPQIFATRRNYASGSSLSFTNTESESSQRKPDNFIVKDKLNTVQISNVQTSNNVSATDSKYESKLQSTVNNQVNNLKYFRRPHVFATQRNYALGTSLESTSTDTESTQSNASVAIVADKLSTVQISKTQHSNKKIELATNNNNENTSESTVKNQVSNIKNLKRPKTFINRRNHASANSLLTKNTDTEGIQSKTTESEAAEEVRTFQISSMQVSTKNAESATYSNYDSDSGSTVNNEETTQKFLRRPQILATRRSYASGASLKSQNTNTESTRTETANTAFSKRQKNRKQSSVEILGDATKTIAENNNSNESGFITGSRKLFKRPQYIASRRYSGADVSLKSANAGTKRAQNASEIVQTINNEAKIDKSSTTYTGHSETATGYNGDSIITVTGSVNQRKYLKRPQYTFRHNNSVIKASVTSSSIDTGKTLSKVTSTQNSDNQVIVGKSLYTNTDRVKTIKTDTTYEDISKSAVNTRHKQNNSATSQYQNSGISVMSTNIDEKQPSLKTVEKTANVGLTLISDSVTLTDKQENYQKSTIASVDETSNTEHTENAIEKVKISGEQVNAQKSLMTNVAATASEMGYNEATGVVVTEEVNSRLYSTQPIASFINSNSKISGSTTGLDSKHLQAEAIENDFKASSSLTDTHHKESETKITAFEDEHVKNAKSSLTNISKSTDKEMIVTIADNQNTITKSLTTNESSNKIQALKKTNIAFLHKVQKEDSTVLTAAGTNSKTAKRPQNIATRRYSASKDSIKSSTVHTEQFQGKTNSIVSLNKQATIGKSLHTNTDTTTNFKAKDNYIKQSKFAAKTKESAEQQYFATRQNKDSEVTLKISNIGVDLTRNQTLNDGANNKIIEDKTLYTNIGRITQTAAESITDDSSSNISAANTSIDTGSLQSETNDTTSSNQQIKFTKFTFTDTAKIANKEQTQIETNNNERKDKEVELKSVGSMYAQKATDNLQHSEKQAYLQSFSSTHTDKGTDTGHTLIQSDTNVFAEDQANVEKSILTTNAGNSQSEIDFVYVPNNQDIIIESSTKTTKSFNGGNSEVDEGSRASTVNFNSKSKISAKGQSNTASSFKSKINTQSDNYNIKLSSQRNPKTSLGKSTEQDVLEESKSTVTGKIRSGIRLRGQTTYQSSKAGSIIKNIKSNDQNINKDKIPTKLLFERSSTKSSIGSSEKIIQSNNSDNVSQYVDPLSHVTKVSSAGATSQTIDARDIQIKDTVVENIQPKPITKHITKTLFRTSTNFKINGGESEELSNLKGEDAFTQPQQNYTKISTLTADSASGYVEKTNIKSTIEKSSTNRFSAMHGQQQEFDRQQHFALEGLSDISQTSTTRKSTNIGVNAEKTSLIAASTKSKGRNNARTIPHSRKTDNTSNTKPIETDGIKTVTKQFTKVIASTPRKQPKEFRKEIIEAVENPIISRKRQKIETVMTTVINNSEKESLQSKRKHSRRVVAGSTIKPVETTEQILTSNVVEPITKISERPVDASTFTLYKSRTETFNSGTSRRNGFESSEQFSSKPTLITREVLEEKPVQFFVENSTPEKSRQAIQSRSKSSSSSWTSTGSRSQTSRFHGDQGPIVPIIEQENHIFSQNGKFKYSYEGGDGTRAFSKGKLKEVSKDHAGEAVEGGFSYTDKDGNDYSMSYTADENGYRPIGAHLPTPPPIPIAIARALAYLATKSTPAPVTEPTRKH